jgi:organic radical activating enzyme
MSQSWVPISTILKTAPKILESPKYAKNEAMVQVDKFLRHLSPRLNRDGKSNPTMQHSDHDVNSDATHVVNGATSSTVMLPQGTEAEVSRERYIQLLGDLKDQGHTPSVYLWGGEPMLYKGSVEIIEEAARLGMPPSIATNGTGLVEHAERLVSAPMFVIQISVDGPDAQTHNASRPGASASVDNFATITRAIDTITEIRKDKKQRLPLIAALTTINNVNYNRLVDIYEVFRNKVDVCVFYLAWWIDEASAQRHSEDFEERFGFQPEKHFGWIGNWRPPDYGVLSIS